MKTSLPRAPTSFVRRLAVSRLEVCPKALRRLRLFPVKLTVAIAQEYFPRNKSDAGKVITERVAAAASAGASLIAFPETWIPGYPAWLDVCRDVALWDHPPVKDAYVEMAEGAVAVTGGERDEVMLAFANAARLNDVGIVAGVVERVPEGPGYGTLYNTMLAFGPDGALRNHHRKLVPTFTERLLWGPGDAEGVRAVPLGDTRVGGLICWEHWMPLARQALHESGEDVHVALWPGVKELHLLASRHYAVEARCFVLAAGSLMRAHELPKGLEPSPELVKSREQLVLRGGSAIIGPDGAFLAGPLYDERGLLVAEIDLNQSRAERMTLDTGGHYHRPDQLELVRHAGKRRLSP